MSDSEDDQSPVLPADAEDALIETTEADNPTEDADTAQMQTDENLNNSIDPDDDPAKEHDDDEEMGDLFGDEDDEPVAQSKKRRLDDEELDSGDDMDREDRMIEDDEPATPPPPKEEVAAEAALPRHASLKGSDGEVYLLQNALQNGIEPKVFDPQTFAPPTTNHHSVDPPTANFSAAQTAAATIRWRRDPRDPTKLQSNSRIIRWSDGSLTLQIGSNALEQYDLGATALAPSQVRPKKPLPASLAKTRGRVSTKKDDAHTYLASVDETMGVGRITNHVTAVLHVRSTKLSAGDDDAVAKLQQALTASNAAKHGTTSTAAGGMQVISQIEDPDLLRKRAERAEKDKVKMERSLQARRDREFNRRQGVMGNAAGLGRSSQGGRMLTVAALEDEAGLGGYGAPRKKGPAKKKQRRNNDMYTDDEDDRGRGGGDEYEKDGFLVSDEDDEEEGGDDDDEEEELLDEDAEGEDEDEAPVQPSVEKSEEPAAARRRGGRQVVDDDDDE